MLVELHTVCVVFVAIGLLAYFHTLRSCQSAGILLCGRSGDHCGSLFAYAGVFAGCHGVLWCMHAVLSRAQKRLSAHHLQSKAEKEKVDCMKV